MKSGVLPLSKKIKHLAVVGVAADDLGVQCGGWTIDWQGGRGNVTHGGTTLLAAIRQTVLPETQVTFSPGRHSDLKNANAVIAVDWRESLTPRCRGDRTNLDLSAEDSGFGCESQSLRANRLSPFYFPAAPMGLRSRAGGQRCVCRGVAAGQKRAGGDGRFIWRLQIHRRITARLAAQQRSHLHRGTPLKNRCSLSAIRASAVNL